MTLALLGSLPGLVAGGLALPPSAPPERVPLEARTHREWTMVLPAESFLTVSGGLPLPDGTLRAAAPDGTQLTVDADGDGTRELRVEGETGLVTLLQDGAPVQAFRLRNQGRGWEYASASTREGRIGKTRVRLVDQDGDGRYDGYGRDAMVVGRGERACFLSRVVNVGGELHTLEVAADGAWLEVAPYAGAAGRLDLRTDLETDGKLLAAVVRSDDGAYSFDLAKARAGLALPAGSYLLHSGAIGLGDATVAILPGRAKPIEVAAGEQLSLAWGGPLAAEFRYARAGAELAIRPDDVRYFGVAGEEYAGWTPRGSSPTFTIRERALGTELTKAIFPGSC